MQEAFRMAITNINDLYKMLYEQYEEGIGQKAKDKSKALSSLQDVVNLFSKSRITGEEKQAQTKYAQSAVSRGLAGSTVPAAVSTGISANFEDMRLSKLSEALTNLANWLANWQSGAPTAQTLSYLATGGFGGGDKGSQSYGTAVNPFDLSPAGGNVISGNQQGLGYQPSSSGSASGSRVPSSSLSLTSSIGGQNIGGSVSDSGGGAWGQTALDLAQNESKKRQTIAGMWASHSQDKMYVNEVEPWSPGSMYSLGTGWTAAPAGSY